MVESSNVFQSPEEEKKVLTNKVRDLKEWLFIALVFSICIIGILSITIYSMKSNHIERLKVIRSELDKLTEAKAPASEAPDQFQGCIMSTKTVDFKPGEKRLFRKRVQELIPGTTRYKELNGTAVHEVYCGTCAYPDCKQASKEIWIKLQETTRFQLNAIWGHYFHSECIKEIMTDLLKKYEKPKEIKEDDKDRA